MAPKVNPFIRCFETRKVNIIAGINMITAIAHIPLQSITNSEVKSRSPTGMVFEDRLLVKTDAS